MFTIGKGKGKLKSTRTPVGFCWHPTQPRTNPFLAKISNKNESTSKGKNEKVVDNASLGKLKPYQRAVLTQLTKNEFVKNKVEFHSIIVDGAIQYSSLSHYTQSQCSVLSQLIKLEEQNIDPLVTANIGKEIKSLTAFIGDESMKIALEKSQANKPGILGGFFNSARNQLYNQYQEVLAKFATNIVSLVTGPDEHDHINLVVIRARNGLDTLLESSNNLPSKHDKAPIIKAQETLAEMMPKLSKALEKYSTFQGKESALRWAALFKLLERDPYFKEQLAKTHGKGMRPQVRFSQLVESLPAPEHQDPLSTSTSLNY